MATEQAPTLKDIFTTKGNKYARKRENAPAAKKQADAATTARLNAANTDLYKAMKADKQPPFGGKSTMGTGPGRSPSSPKPSNKTQANADLAAAMVKDKGPFTMAQS